MDDLEYITKDALMMCDQGGAPDFFTPTYNTHIKVHGLVVSTNKDGQPTVNIPSFKVCKLTGGPCIPATMPDTWQDTWQVKVKGSNTLIGRSTIRCPVGGKIEFMTSGQVPLPDDAAQEVKDLQDQAQRELDDSGQGNSVGETGFAEGMIPVWGSGRDMINDIQTGDVGGAILNAGFLLWDVGSIVAGIFSFGAGTVAMQGAKAGVKAGIKSTAKAIGKKALEGLGKASFRKLGKEALEKSMKALKDKLKCFVVRACFTGETLVSVPNGYKKIEELKIGDEILSFDGESQEVVIRRVVSLFQEQVEEILEIETETGVISTTRNHPFFVNGEYKDAGQITPGEFLFTKDMSLAKVLSINYKPALEKVYNFEVEDSHCYFVGEDGVLVLNACFHTTFFNTFPHLKGKVVVHHAVEQQVLKKWPGLFDKEFMHSLENLRGIPKELNNTLHLSTIRKEWNRFYDLYKNLGVTPSKQSVLDFAKHIDNKYGHLFNPPLK